MSCFSIWLVLAYALFCVSVRFLLRRARFLCSRARFPWSWNRFICSSAWLFLALVEGSLTDVDVNISSNSRAFNISLMLFISTSMFRYFISRASFFRFHTCCFIWHGIIFQYTSSFCPLSSLYAYFFFSPLMFFVDKLSDASCFYRQ